MSSRPSFRITLSFLLALAFSAGLRVRPGTPADRTVEIVRDRWGVPHIYAGLEEDAFYGLGHATAEDRTIQMELFRRRGRGRLAEVYGSGLVDSDRRFRIAGIPRYCDEAAAALPADVRGWFESYAAGVNAYRAAEPAETGRRFATLGVPPEPWTAGDCVCSWMGFSEVFDRLFDDGPVTAYREFEAAVAAVGPEEASRRRALTVDDAAAVVPESEMAKDSVNYQALKSRKPVPGGWMSSTPDDLLRFSHAWAVDGTRSSRGKPLLASDPQTAVSNPPVWYEFHLSAGRFDVRGIGVAGAPGMLIGFNRQIAWGVTALGASSTVTYLEKVSPDRQTYEYRGRTQLLEKRMESIAVKGQGPVSVEIARTHHGFVFDTLASGVGPNESFVTHNPQVEQKQSGLVGLLGMMAAGGWNEFRTAMAAYFSPGLHLVYADTSGSIGYQTLLYLPRTRRTPKIALEGWSGLDEPEGGVPLDELPHTLNPDSHFVSHANNIPVGSWYPYDLGIGTGGIGHTARSLRLVQLLTDNRLHTVDSFESEIHRDNVQSVVAALLPVAGRVAAETPGVSRQVADLLSRVRNWDLHYRASADGHGASMALAQGLLLPFRRSNLAAQLGGGEGGLSHLARVLWTRYGTSDQSPRDADVRSYLLAWLDAAATNYTSTWARREPDRGQSRETWSMPYQAAGPLGLPGIDASLDVQSPPLECIQGGTIWSQTGNSYTQIVDLADVDNSRSVLPPGISENPASPFHLDQMELWVRGGTHPAPLSRSRIESLASSRRVLVIRVQEPANQYGPWNRDLLFHTSSDGLRFEPRGTFVERGGVPSLARGLDGRLYAVFQWFPLDNRAAFDRIAIMTSGDAGETWTAPRTIEMSGLPASLYRSFDPTLGVLPDGRFRLYFSSERGSAGNTRGNRAIYSAISDDALNYRFEPGERFGFPNQETYDVAVALQGGLWHLYCPASGGRGGIGYYATSADGLAFEQRRMVTIGGQRQWLGNVVSLGDRLRFYGSGEGAWAADSFDGFRWTLREPKPGLGGDPAVVVAGPGRFLAVSTGPLRPDAKPGPAPIQ